MELMPGYKRSDVGVIPDDWDVLPLGKLVRSVEYGSAAKSDVRGAVPVLRMGNLQGGKIDWSDLVYTDDIDEINKYTLQPGDVLFNRTNTIDLVGKTSIYEGGRPAIFAGYLIRINVVPDLLDSRFLNYILNTEFSRKYSAKVLSVAVGQANINGQKLKTYPIPLPPTKTEQEDIAQALSDADKLLVALDPMIAKKRDLKQAAMQQLLTGETRLPGFNGEWEEKALGEIATISKGVQLHSSETDPDGHIPHYNGGMQPSSFTTSFNTPANTIAISEGGNSCGFVQFITEPFWCGGHCYAVVPKSVDNGFLFHALKSQQSAIMGLRVGSGLPNVQKTALGLFKLKFPKDPIEQTAIADVLSDMDTELSDLERRREKTRTLKQAMMQELLTGKTRLVEPRGANA
ncbi:restriction endonuclease subunit S [Aeromonas veronii]